MRVLAIDASLRNTGVAIVDANNGKPQSVYFGTIHNKSAMRPSSCLVCIRDRLAELIREHAPDCCALESVIYVQSYKDRHHPRRGAWRGHSGRRRKRIAGIRIFAKTNQAINSRARRSRQKSGRVHGARAAWSNRNAGCRRRRRAGDRSYSSAHARSSGAWSSGRNANMNLELMGLPCAVRRSRKLSGQRHVPIFMCAGSAERNSHMRSHCRKNSLRKTGGRVA